MDQTTISHLPLFCCIVGLNICPHGVGNVWGRVAAELCHLHCINQPHVLCISCTCTIPPSYYKHCTMLQLHIPPNHHPQLGRLKERRRGKEFLKLKNGLQYRHSPEGYKMTKWASMHKYILCRVLPDIRKQPTPTTSLWWIHHHALGPKIPNLLCFLRVSWL